MGRFANGHPIGLACRFDAAQTGACYCNKLRRPE
jgi:hypothetical protein